MMFLILYSVKLLITESITGTMMNTMVTSRVGAISARLNSWSPVVFFSFRRGWRTAVEVDMKIPPLVGWAGARRRGREKVSIKWAG